MYPLDKVTKDNRPFWSLPKRPPHHMEFDPENKLHQDFIAAYACLLARVTKVPIPSEEPRSAGFKADLAQKAAAVKVKEFKINDAKASQIAEEVDKEMKSSKADQEEEKEKASEELIDTATGVKEVAEVEEVLETFTYVIQPLKDQESELEKTLLDV